MNTKTKDAKPLAARFLDSLADLRSERDWLRERNETLAIQLRSALHQLAHCQGEDPRTFSERWRREHS